MWFLSALSEQFHYETLSYNFVHLKHTKPSKNIGYSIIDSLHLEETCGIKTLFRFMVLHLTYVHRINFKTLTLTSQIYFTHCALSINVFLVPLQIDYKLDIHCIGGPDNILHNVKGGMQNKLVEMCCLIFLHAKQRVRISWEFQHLSCIHWKRLLLILLEQVMTIKETLVKCQQTNWKAAESHYCHWKFLKVCLQKKKKKNIGL